MPLILTLTFKKNARATSKRPVKQQDRTQETRASLSVKVGFGYDLGTLAWLA